MGRPPICDRASVLLVGDDPQLRRLIVQALGQVRCAALEAANGQEAVERAAGGRVDLVIVDLGVSDVLGSDAVRRLRIERPDLNALYLVGRAKAGRRLDLETTDMYLDKPFTLNDLCEAVARGLNRGPLH